MFLRLKAWDNTAQGKAKRRPGLIKQNFLAAQKYVKKGSMLNIAAIVIQYINNNIQQSFHS
jgi:hypothetical protein